MWPCSLKLFERAARVEICYKCVFATVICMPVVLMHRCALKVHSMPAKILHTNQYESCF